MGIIRKATSISTGGVVHYRTANQKTARYAKKSYKLEKKQAGGNRELSERGNRIALLIAVVIVGGLILYGVIAAYG